MNNENYYFFWSGECSQWYISEFEEFGERFNCAEQFMMAAKAKVFRDDLTYRLIMETQMPMNKKLLAEKFMDLYQKSGKNLQKIL